MSNIGFLKSKDCMIISRSEIIQVIQLYISLVDEGKSTCEYGDIQTSSV